MESLARWTWDLIARYGFAMSSSSSAAPPGLEGLRWAHDESPEEKALVQAGLNPMAAQIVLAARNKANRSQRMDGSQAPQPSGRSFAQHPRHDHAHVIPTLAPPPFRGAARSRGTFSFLRYLFPNTHRRARESLLGFRLEYAPRLRTRAQSSLYQILVRRQHRKRQRREAGRGLAPFWQRRKSRILGVIYGQRHAGAGPSRGTRPLRQMTSYGEPGARVPGARRERLRGYLRAANELRQTYQAEIQQRLQASETDGHMPGDFPDVDIARSGDEEMLLFPSYARRHTTRRPAADDLSRVQPGTHESVETPHSSGDAEYWKREWERYEDANAIVDVDVRGWIYTPQQGPLNRKNRLLVAVARRLSGVYAPTPSPSASRPSSQAPADRTRWDENSSRYEDEVAAREADNIARHGQQEADAAVTGSYSLAVASKALNDSPLGSRSGSPSRAATEPRLAPDQRDDGPGQASLTKRQSWNEPANMTRDEMAAANELLLTRLKPFMTNPLVQSPITVFFFNDHKSASKSVTTDESGHFNLRAALDFVPSQVRVLASDKLSATEDVIITESRGVSVISDIDDTIKHSAIASGAREIFKNTFIRDLGDLTVQGVKEWYGALAAMGVKLHYVSNSPWQLYPLIRSYFALVGLPPGSFHLKQYSGMLQGIFEPAAERKRGSLDRIMNDFPERKFILVGDSGEADLEVYTDVVLDHPGRVLGVFIRDVTTPSTKGFFDPSMTLSDSRRPSRNGTPLPSRSRGRDDPEYRPSLPARPVAPPDIKTPDPDPEPDLIDFSEDDTPPASDSAIQPMHADDLRQIGSGGKPSAPPKPNKPSSLRNFSKPAQAPAEDKLSTSDSEILGAAKRQPPPPPNPRRSGTTTGATETAVPMSARSLHPSPRPNPGHSGSEPPRPTKPSVASPTAPASISRTNTSATSSSTSSYQDEGYVASARRQIATAYNALPALRSQSQSGPADQTGIGADARPTPPIPLRRGLSSYPAAAARWATGASGGDPAAGGDAGALGASYDKKLEIWKRRWARAEEIMDQRRVVLRSWRVGADVMDECVALVKKELEKGGRRGPAA